MGTTLSTAVGYGIRLPWGEDDECDFTDPFYWDFFDDEDRDEFSRPDTYEIGAALEKRFPLLTVESSYYRDWSGPDALLIKSTVQNTYGAGVFPVTYPTYPFAEYRQLLDASHLLGLGNVPGWLVVVSYG